MSNHGLALAAPPVAGDLAVAPPPPADLRQWVEECQLIQLVLEAVQQTLPDGTQAVADVAAPNARMLLTLLTYCYAADVLASEDVEWAAQNDPAVRYIGGSSPPDTNRLRRFRRANRALLEACLTKVLTEVLTANRDEPVAAPRWGDRPGAVNNPATAAWVRRKLELAVMMDAAAAD